MAENYRRAKIEDLRDFIYERIGHQYDELDSLKRRGFDDPTLTGWHEAKIAAFEEVLSRILSEFGISPDYKGRESQSESVKVKCLGGMEGKFVTISKGTGKKTLKFVAGGFLSRSEIEGKLLEISKEDDNHEPLGADFGRMDYRNDMQGQLGIADTYVPVFILKIQTIQGKEHEFRLRCTPEQMQKITSWVS